MLIFARVLLVNFFYVWYSFFKIEYCDVGNEIKIPTRCIWQMFIPSNISHHVSISLFPIYLRTFFRSKKIRTVVFRSKNCKWNCSFFHSNRYFREEWNEMQSSETFLFNEMYQITQWNKWNVFTKRYLFIAKTVQMIVSF